jgi:hypothetical protein
MVLSSKTAQLKVENSALITSRFSPVRFYTPGCIWSWKLRPGFVLLAFVLIIKLNLLKGATTLSITTFSIATHNIKGLFATFSITTLSITTLCISTLCNYAECHYAELSRFSLLCWVFHCYTKVVMLNIPLIQVSTQRLLVIITLVLLAFPA